MTKINWFLFFFSSACKIFCLKAKIQLRSGHGVQKRDNCSSAALSGFCKATISKRQTHLWFEKLFSAEFTGLWTQTSSLKAAMRRKLNFAFCEIGTGEANSAHSVCFVQRFEANSTRRSGFWYLLCDSKRIWLLDVGNWLSSMCGFFESRFEANIWSFFILFWSSNP